MQLVDSTVREIFQESGVDGMIRHIDYCAGVCYNRHGYTKDSYKFVKSLFEKGHMRPLEFGTVNIDVECSYTYKGNHIHLFLVTSPYSMTDLYNDDTRVNVTTNFRVICEFFNDFDLAYEFVKDRWVELPFFVRRTFAWTCGRAIADEFRTHITLSSIMKSTRYVNETKNGDIRFVKPYWCIDADREAFLADGLNSAERYYHDAIAMGMKPQEARELLPLSVETELYQCGFCGYSDIGWGRFLIMRLDESAHPDAQKLARELESLINK